MQNSSNYNLKLFDGTDTIKRQDFVDNFTTIDTQMKNIDNKHSAYGTTSGTNSYTINITGITSYYDGLKVVIKIGTTCTGASSLNINNLGAKTILDGSGNTITSGSLKAGIPYNLCYNGTNFILLGKGGGGGGTATANQILSGQTATTNNGLITGTMSNRGAISSIINCDGSYTIPEGYHNGNGKITANSLASQTSATATASQILSGQTAYVNGNKITGNMPNLSSNSSISYANGNNTKVIVGDQAFGPITNTDGTNRVLIRYNNTNGFVTGNTLVGVSTSNMASQLGITSDKIVAGNNICGVNGTATVGSMGGRRCIFGQFKPIDVQYEFKNMNGVAFNFYVISVSGIPFTPRFVFAWDITNITSSTIFERNDGRIIVTRFKRGNTSGFQEHFPLETNGQAIFKEWLQLPVANTNTWNYIILE